MDPEAVFPQTTTGRIWGQARLSPGHHPAVEASQAAGDPAVLVRRQGRQFCPSPQGTVCLTAGPGGCHHPGWRAGRRADPRWTSLPRRWSPAPGNVPAGTVQTMSVAPVGIAAATVPPFAGGRAAEGTGPAGAGPGHLPPAGRNKTYYAQQAWGAGGGDGGDRHTQGPGEAGHGGRGGLGPTACRGTSVDVRSRPSLEEGPAGDRRGPPGPGSSRR